MNNPEFDVDVHSHIGLALIRSGLSFESGVTTEGLRLWNIQFYTGKESPAIQITMYITTQFLIVGTHVRVNSDVSISEFWNDATRLLSTIPLVRLASSWENEDRVFWVRTEAPIDTAANKICPLTSATILGALRSVVSGATMLDQQHKWNLEFFRPSRLPIIVTEDPSSTEPEQTAE